MGKSCCEVPCSKQEDKSFSVVLWIALVLNATMFGVEFYSSFKADSVSLLADAVDFLGDAGNYAISLIVLPLAVSWRSKAAWIKGMTMLLYGLFVLGKSILFAFNGAVPSAHLMGAIGTAALLVNLLVAFLLFKFRGGDANKNSVWICSRNDAIGNLAVLAAAFLISKFHNNWPDIIVAFVMAYLAISGGYQIVKASLAELKMKEAA